MGAAHTTKKKFEPVGPFDPPLPTEAARQEKKPMAVAGDEDAKAKAELPTTQFQDQMDPEVAEKWQDPNLKDGGRHERTGGKEGDAEAERNPPGFEKSRQEGYVEMDTEE